MFFFEAQTALERWHVWKNTVLFVSLPLQLEAFFISSFCTKKTVKPQASTKKLSSSLVNHLNDVSWDGKHSSWKALKRVGMTGKIFTKDVIQHCSLNVLMCPRMVCNFCLAVRALLSFTALPWYKWCRDVWNENCASCKFRFAGPHMNV